MITRPAPPPIRDDWALFLDLDGTLIDIAPTPDSVHVEESLPQSIALLRQRLGNAVAIVSGRKLSDIDRFIPGTLPCGAEHGAVLRDAAGKVTSSSAAPSIPAHWVAAPENAASELPGVLIEPKRHAVAVHWRLAPQAAAAMQSLAAWLTEGDPRFELMAAHMAIEIRARGATKAGPVTFLMQGPPFRGRVPVFVGDDVTDEDGMAAAREHGGFGLRVAEAFGHPQAVRDWLARGAAGL